MRHLRHGLCALCPALLLACSDAPAPRGDARPLRDAASPTDRQSAGDRGRAPDAAGDLVSPPEQGSADGPQQQTGLVIGIDWNRAPKRTIDRAGLVAQYVYGPGFVGLPEDWSWGKGSAVVDDPKGVPPGF